MLDSILSTSTSSIDPTALLLCTLASLAVGVGAALVYMYNNQYNRRFVITLALLPAIVQMVIMLVNGNLGTGVAVMGAFSLIRFRSVPGNARDIGAIFLAMALGTGHRHGLHCSSANIPGNNRRRIHSAGQVRLWPLKARAQ